MFQARAQTYGVHTVTDALIADPFTAQSWMRTMLSNWVTTTWHLVRLSWLLLIFAPVILSAPLALSWGLYRPGKWHVARLGVGAEIVLGTISTR